jgi:hypothetical protein
METLPRQTDALRNLPLWAGLFAGPVPWTFQLPVAYALGWRACGNRSLLPAHLVSGLCLAVALGGIVLARRQWRDFRGWPSDWDAGVDARVRLLPVVGRMTGTLFSVVIIALWLALVFLPPCPE